MLKLQLCFTQNELKTQPVAHRMVHSVLPYISQLKTVFLTDGDIYRGDGEVAISGGFLSSGDYRNAKHAILFAQSPYRDAMRKSHAGDDWFAPYKNGSREIGKNIWLNDRFLVFDDIASIAKDNDYRIFAGAVNTALKSWGIWNGECGISKEDSIVSDTGEICFDPGRSRFCVNAPGAAIFSGKPDGEIRLGTGTKVICSNDRITLWKLPLDEQECAFSRHFLLFAIGRSGMDETRYELCENGRDCKMFLKGKLYLETLEGEILLESEDLPNVWVLDIYGKRIGSLEGTKINGSWHFACDSTLPGANYEVVF